MSEIKNCPNCNTSIKNGLLSSVKLLTKKKVFVINEYHDSESDGYCSKCGNELYVKYNVALKNERIELTNRMQNLIKNIPVISTHSPLNWNYDVLDMVTGQTTTGTGVISEFTSTFTDLFGAQSERHNSKLKAGEDMCFAQLRMQTLNRGGNAVIATDIDYSELGATKGMIMVCMAGTSVKLKNTELLGEERAKMLTRLVTVYDRLRHLNPYSVDEY